MNCPKCGTPVMPGAAFCPICNEPLQQSPTIPPQGFPNDPNAVYGQQPGYSQQPPVNGMPGGYQQPYPNGYQAGQQSGYQPGYPPYQQTYPTGYQQPYQYGETRQNPFSSAMSELPHVFSLSFKNPGEAFHSLLERSDTITGPILCGVVLLLSFFAGMTVARGVVSIFFSAVSSLTGVSPAGSASSMNQGINYVAGRIAPSVGGVTVLCQLISMLVPVLVSGIYLLVICKVPFSWPVIFGLVSIPSIPSAIAALAGMLLSLLSPWLTIVCVLCGMAFSYLQLGALLQYVTGRSEQQLFLPKTACILLSLLLTLLLHLLIGGGLMGNVLNYMIQLLSNVGSLL